MTWVAVATVGGAVLGAGITSRGAQRAADTQAQAAGAAGQLGAQAAATVRNDLQPFTQGGASAFNELLGFIGVPGADSAQGIRGRLESIPRGVVGADDVAFAFTELLGRSPTDEEIRYYTGERSTPGTPLRARGNELWTDIIEPNIDSLPQGGGVPSAQDSQLDFLQNHPLFSLGLENLNEQTNAASAARGNFASGGTATEIFENALAAGGPLLDQRFNQLFSAANLGQNSAAQSGNAALAGAGALGNSFLAGGNAIAAGQIAQSQSQARLLESLFTAIPSFYSQPTPWQRFTTGGTNGGLLAGGNINRGSAWFDLGG